MKAVMWSKPMCPYCDRARALLETKGVEIEERKVGQEWTKEQLLEDVPTARTVPQIFLDGKYIGSYTELRAYLEECQAS